MFCLILKNIPPTKDEKEKEYKDAKCPCVVAYSSVQAL